MLSNLVDLLVECVKMLAAMCGLFNYRLKKSIVSFVMLGISIVVIIAAGIIDSSHRISAFAFTAVVICAFSLEGKRRFLVSTMTFFGICILDELCTMLIKTAFGIPDEVMTDNEYIFSVVNAFSIVPLTIAAFLTQKLVHSKRSPASTLNELSPIYVVMLIVGQISSLLFIAPFTIAGYKSTIRNNYVVAIAACLLCILFMILGALLIYDKITLNQYKQVSKLNRKIISDQEKYYHMLLEKETETRKFRHDIRNHILCLFTMLSEEKYSEAQEYLTCMSDFSETLKPRCQTGNILVNAIVNDISSKYSEVALEWKGCIPEGLRLSDMEVCVIFSNLLDNAFCAASACKNGWVKVVVRTAAGGMTISVRNNMSAVPVIVDGHFITSKAEKNEHGFGTMNVRTCVTDNGGEVDYSFSEDEFDAEVILPFAVGV